MQYRALLPVLLLVALTACGEKKEPAPTPTPAATPAAPAPASGGSEPMVLRQPGGPGAYQDEAYAEYAQLAVELPRRVTDSIIQANKANPRLIEREMTRALKHHDTLVRQDMAARRGITVDSLNAILKMKDKEAE